MELGTVLYEHRTGLPPRGGNVIAASVERGWITPFGSGQYVYRSQWTRLVRQLQRLILARAYEAGFEEWTFPRLLPAAALDSFELTQFAPELLVNAELDGPCFLDPVQCAGFYHSLRNSRLPALPIRVVECLGGWTWRKETAASLDGPYRSSEFLRVEHVYIGTPDQVVAIRERVRQGLLTVLDDLRLSWHVVVGRGCMDLPEIRARQESAAGASEVPVQDIEVPIRGTLKPDAAREALKALDHEYRADGGRLRRPNDQLYLDADELCGCSVEGDHLLRSFNITGDVDQLWSGCCGIGLNRLVLAVLYQHGFDVADWPPILRPE